MKVVFCNLYIVFDTLYYCLGYVQRLSNVVTFICKLSLKNCLHGKNKSNTRMSITTHSSDVVEEKQLIVSNVNLKQNFYSISHSASLFFL